MGNLLTQMLPQTRNGRSIADDISIILRIQKRLTAASVDILFYFAFNQTVALSIECKMPVFWNKRIININYII